jgi:putative ABC transport system ATP-binding protein
MVASQQQRTLVTNAFINLLQASVENARAGSLPVGLRRILVVDHDKDTAHYVCSYLEKSGYDALQAHDGETALQTIRREKPDLVVLELTLPDRDGLDLIRTIRADPYFVRLPVIILSARASESDKRLGLDSGADDYVAKPFNSRELMARVGAVLRRYYRQNARTKPATSNVSTQPSLPQIAEEGNFVSQSSNKLTISTMDRPNLREAEQLPSREEEEDKTMDRDQKDKNGTLIQIANMTKVYRMGEVQVQALRGISLVVHPGEYVAIMGASGSGKSTLMNMIGLLDQPTSGSYRIRGEETSQLGKRKLTDMRNHEIGFVFQQFNLLPRISARRQVELPLFYAGIPRRQGQEMAMEALAKVGLADRASHRPDELSGGEQQRVAIARALVNQPSLLLADEPTGALDSKTGAEVLDLIQQLHTQGLTVVMVTHDPQVARRAERVITLSDGIIISDEENGRKLARWVMEAHHEGN